MNMIIENIRYIVVLGFLILIIGCEPYEADDIELPAGPTASFTWDYLPGDSNRIVVQSTGDPGFQRIWDFGNGSSSLSLMDTAYFPAKGDYEVVLTISDRGGSSTSNQLINIPSSDASSCNDDNFIWLTGGCTNPNGKSWRLSSAAGAVIVGPTRGSSQWYSSPQDGHAPEQADDVYHFVPDDNEYDYMNQGMTIFPECNYDPKPFTPDPDATWQLSPGTGWYGADQIILSPNSFIGTKDSGPIYDIISISEDEITVESELLGGGGYFRFIIIKI